MKLHLVAAAIAVLLIAAPARADWPALGATTTIEGARTGFALVRVPRPIALQSADGAPVARVRLRGSGRLYGVVLRQDDPAVQEPVELMNTSGDGDGDPAEMPLYQVSGFPRNGPPALPAGTYRLYLIADGRPVHAEVAIAGLEGVATVTPDVPVAEHLEPLLRLDNSGGPAAMFAGQAALPSRGLIVVRPHMTSDFEIDRRSEVCFYGPQDGAVDETSFAPGCGDPLWLAEQIAFADIEPPLVPPGPHEQGYEAWAPEAEAGTWTLGGNSQEAGTPGTMEMLGAWMSYDPPPGVALPEPPSEPVVVPPASTPSANVPAPAARPSRKARRSRTPKRHRKARRHARAHRRRAAHRAHTPVRGGRS